MSDAPDPKDATPKVIENSEDPNKTPKDKEFDQAAKDIAERTTDDKLTMEIKVFSPFVTYFEGTAFSITAENDTGVFDILPKHHNFISLLKACTISIRTTKGEEQKINIGGGLMHVKADKVVVFLDV